jgi:hypothetical protein
MHPTIFFPHLTHKLTEYQARKDRILVGFEVLTAVTTKSTIFSDITSCNQSSEKPAAILEEHVASIFRVEE